MKTNPNDIEVIDPEIVTGDTETVNNPVVDFIYILDNETINKIRNSKSDAEVRRILKTKIK